VRGKLLLLALIISLALNVSMAVMLLARNGERYEVKITEVFFPRVDETDSRIVRLYVVNYSPQPITNIEVEVSWLRGDETFHREVITVHRVDGMSFFQYDYHFDFEGAATMIRYAYDGTVREFRPSQ